MEKQESIKIFEEKRIRTLWDEEQEKWYFSVVDVVQVLTGSVNPTDYLKKMRKRDPNCIKGGDKLSPPFIQIRVAVGKNSISQILEGFYV